MSTPTVNAFSAHALTFLYDVHGYDVLLHELEMIHYLRTRSFASSAEKEEPVKEKGKKKDANTKTVVIAEKNARVVSASNVVDDSRCIALVGKDQHQCSVRANKTLSGAMRLCKKHYMLATDQKETSSVASSSHEESEDEEEDELE